MRWVKIFNSRDQAGSAIAEGSARRIVFGELRIALARWKGEFYAIEDACPHSGAYLSQGMVNNSGELVCPLHSYCYDLRTGREFQQMTRDARTWSLKWEGGQLYLGVEE